MKGTKQGHGGSVMVWGGVSEQEQTQLVFVDGNLNGQRYINEVLEPVVLPLAQNHGDQFILMDDNARPHRANLVHRFLADHHIQRMDPWPSCSPDMNPIETLWDQLGKAVNDRIQPRDRLPQLRRYLTEEWNNMPQQRIARLVTSMRRRCAALIHSHGGPTRY